MSFLVNVCEKYCCSQIFFSPRIANVVWGCTVWDRELFSGLGTVCRHCWWEVTLLRGGLRGRSASTEQSSCPNSSSGHAPSPPWM